MSAHLPDPPHAIIRAASRELDHALDQIEADAVVAAYRERATARLKRRLALLPVVDVDALIQRVEGSVKP